MIRGYIEVATQEVVQGWIYDSGGGTRNRRVLAFSGKDCVGSGKVEVYRDDLAKAGLGDGYLGFSFGVTLDAAAVGSLVIRFDGSDAVLLQPDAVVSLAATGAATPITEAIPRSITTAGLLDPAALERQLASLRWQRKRARLSQAMFDYLHALWSEGVFDLTLVKRAKSSGTSVTSAATTVAAEALEAYLGADAEISVIKSVSAATFKTELTSIKDKPLIAPVIALCSNDRMVVRVVHGSHIDLAPDVEQLPLQSQYTEHKLGPDNLLVMDARVSAELISPGPSLSFVTAAAKT